MQPMFRIYPGSLGLHLPHCESLFLIGISSMNHKPAEYQLHFPINSNFHESGQESTWQKENRAPFLLGELTPKSSPPLPYSSLSQSKSTPKWCPAVMGAEIGEQERVPGMYRGRVKSFQEQTAWVSSPNIEVKLMVMLSGPR